MNNELSLVRFLMVDDDEDHSRLVERSLSEERIGNSFVRFPCGLEALKYLRHKGKHANALLPSRRALDLRH